MRTFRYTAVAAKQSPQHTVVCFAATPQDILQFADIDRVGRDSSGALKGFQRPQIASHIHDIRDYLLRDDAVLPNPLVIAFIKGASAKTNNNGTIDLQIDVGDTKPGWVVDGQQRLTALSGIQHKDFHVFVSALICRDYEELRQQFVLINNTRPLPKSLIYELLPSTPGLPGKFTARAFAAKVVEILNYDESYHALRGKIRQHTNPSGVISDSAVQKIVMNSATDGAVRSMLNSADYISDSAALIDRFFEAASTVFPEAWNGHKPTTSRLVHGAGMVAMGFVMEYIVAKTGENTVEAFVAGLQPLAKPGVCAWTAGHWNLSLADQRPWNKIQNVPQDTMALASYLVRICKGGWERNGSSTS